MLGLLLAPAGCEEITEPVVRVDLQSVKSTIEPGESTQVIALVMEDGDPVSDTEVQFSASPVGTFPGGDQEVTDAQGQAATSFLVDPNDVDSDTLVEVTATELESSALDTVTISVDVGGRGPR
jgi:hypothetical protein